MWTRNSTRTTFVAYACVLLATCAVARAAPTADALRRTIDLPLQPGDRIAPTYVVDLDAPPDARWAEIAKEYSAAMKPAIEYLRTNAGKGSLLYGLVTDLIAAVTAPGGSWNAERTAEMQGFADSAGYELFDIQAANLFYEYEPGHFLRSAGATTAEAAALTNGWKWCTSIVAQHANGSIFHARNQDYSLPGLTNITITVVFRKGGEDLWVGTTFSGYLGAPTGLRYAAGGVGGWSVNADSRFTVSGLDPAEGVAAAKKGGKAVGFMIRDAMESCATFDEAVAWFNTTETIGPSYYTMAGVNPSEGAVVSRKRDGPDNSHKSKAAPQGEGIWSLNDGTEAPAQWFRVETNFDHWSPITDGRRAPANAHMKALGDTGVTLDKMFDLLSIKPVLAPDTVYTTVMWPAQSLFQSIIRPGY